MSPRLLGLEGLQPDRTGAFTANKRVDPPNHPILQKVDVACKRLAAAPGPFLPRRLATFASVLGAFLSRLLNPGGAVLDPQRVLKNGML